MAYDPNGPLAVRPIDEWFDQQPHGTVLCDPFMQAGVEDAPKEPLAPGAFPEAFEESDFLRGGFRFWKQALERFPDLEIGVLLTRGNRPDDLDGATVDEFEDQLVARASFVGYGLGNRFETDAEAATTGRWRHEYGRRIEDAAEEFGVPVFNFDPVIIPGVSTGPAEDLLQDMDDRVRALAFELGRDHDLVQAASLHARYMWQVHAVGAIGLYLNELQLPPERPGLIVVSKEHLGLYTKLDKVLPETADGPRVAASPVRSEALPQADAEWDIAAIMDSGYFVPQQYDITR